MGTSRCSGIECHGWRATVGCSPYGKRSVSEDRDCDEVVPSSSSGFCLCDGGRRTAYSDCQHPEFTCRERCKLVPSTRCPQFDSTIRSSSATGCTGSVLVENLHSGRVVVYFIAANGVETKLFSLSPSSRNTVSVGAGCYAKITHFCSPMAVRVYDEQDGALLHQAVFPTASSYHMMVTSCYCALAVAR